MFLSKRTTKTCNKDVVIFFKNNKTKRKKKDKGKNNANMKSIAKQIQSNRKESLCTCFKNFFYIIVAIEELSSVTEACMVGSLLFNCKCSRNYNLEGSTPETQKHKEIRKETTLY